jgi:hypothetical protein
MTRVKHYICNIKIKDFLLCQYVIYGPVRIILTEDEVWGFFTLEKYIKYSVYHVTDSANEIVGKPHHM